MNELIKWWSIPFNSKIFIHPNFLKIDSEGQEHAMPEKIKLKFYNKILSFFCSSSVLYNNNLYIYIYIYIYIYMININHIH